LEVGIIWTVSSVSHSNDSRRTGTDDGWLSRERALVVVLAFATGLALYVCYYLVRPFLPALAWALALAVVAHPLHAYVGRRINKPNLAAGLAVVVVAIVLIAPAVFVGQQLTAQVANGAKTISSEIEKGTWWARIERQPRLASLLRPIEQRIDIEQEVKKLVPKLTGGVSSIISSTIWVLAMLLITLFALFFFFRDRRYALASLRSLVPLSEEEADEVFKRIADSIYATVYGTLLVALIQGALGGLIFGLLGLPSPLLWGSVMAIMATIPVLGTFVVWMPAALYLALTGSWVKALILVGWGALVVSTIDNLLYPVLVGDRLRLHTLPVFLAIVGGILLFGGSGVILGPLAFVVTVALIDIWRRRTAGGRAAEKIPA